MLTALSAAVKSTNRWKKGPFNAQLKDIFYTSKHEWYTRTREERLRIVNLGKLSYAKGLEEQKKFVEIVKQAKLQNDVLNFLLAVEHTPVYTVGIRSKLYTEEEELKLKTLGADFYRTSRGGLITFHGPGQLVIYPIFNLKHIAPRPVGVKKYVEMLEQVVIDCASKDFNISNVGRTQHTGVWVGQTKKLAALGIAVSHGVSYHGLAMNCNTDLSWFDHVVACGIEGAEATSLSRECERDVTISEALPKMVAQFARIFDCNVES
ncbi:unnamed protein product [Cylicostephanus goldi]|uniref:Octanoyl-[acyl-carrier-protein]:protein N-octanoyltransferase LIPT2, mitochondrial n=1 Tax=Cylicostephanus goldi TaxID=71465 RepID=A0A3P6SN35_CYLGO|nr:unnamed protein product [Cylicostephanus goldi]